MKFTSSREPIPFTFTPPPLFAIPAGCYRAVVTDVSTVENDEGDPVLQFLFDVVAGENGPVEHSACVEYPATREGHAKLNQDLTAFLDKDEIDRLMGMPAELDLTDLIGDEVDMMVSTFTGSDHPTYSRVTGLYSAGSLITGDDSILLRVHRSGEFVGLPTIVDQAVEEQRHTDVNPQALDRKVVQPFTDEMLHDRN